jgi:hypothetical protein
MVIRSILALAEMLEGKLSIHELADTKYSHAGIGFYTNAKLLQIVKESELEVHKLYDFYRRIPEAEAEFLEHVWHQIDKEHRELYTKELKMKEQEKLFNQKLKNEIRIQRKIGREKPQGKQV